MQCWHIEFQTVQSVSIKSLIFSAVCQFVKRNFKFGLSLLCVYYAESTIIHDDLLEKLCDLSFAWYQ